MNSIRHTVKSKRTETHLGAEREHFERQQVSYPHRCCVRLTLISLSCDGAFQHVIPLAVSYSALKLVRL